MPVFRRMGFRTQTEIDQEKYALKALRGDCRDAGQGADGGRLVGPRQALEAARR